MKIAWLVGIAILWPAFSWAQHSQNYHIALEGRYWYPRLDSTVKVVENQVGADIDPVDDLGFDAEKGFGEGRFQIRLFQYHKFNFSYLPLKWKGAKVISRSLQFSGQNYPAGTRVDSDMEIKMLKGGYEYEFFGGWLGFFAATIDVLIADASIQLKASSLGIDEKERRRIPIPMVGLNSRLHLGKYADLTAKISGLPAGGSGYIYDLDGSLDIYPIKNLGFSLGYRFMGVRGAYEENLLKMKLEGPFASLTIRF